MRRLCSAVIRAHDPVFKFMATHGLSTDSPMTRRFVLVALELQGKETKGSGEAWDAFLKTRELFGDSQVEHVGLADAVHRLTEMFASGVQEEGDEESKKRNALRNALFGLLPLHKMLASELIRKAGLPDNRASAIVTNVLVAFGMRNDIGIQMAFSKTIFDSEKERQVALGIALECCFYVNSSARALGPTSSLAALNFFALAKINTKRKQYPDYLGQMERASGKTSGVKLEVNLNPHFELTVERDSKRANHWVCAAKARLSSDALPLVARCTARVSQDCLLFTDMWTLGDAGGPSVSPRPQTSHYQVLLPWLYMLIGFAAVNVPGKFAHVVMAGHDRVFPSDNVVRKLERDGGVKDTWVDGRTGAILVFGLPEGVDDSKVFFMERGEVEFKFGASGLGYGSKLLHGVEVEVEVGDGEEDEEGEGAGDFSGQRSGPTMRELERTKLNVIEKALEKVTDGPSAQQRQDLMRIMREKLWRKLSGTSLPITHLNNPYDLNDLVIVLSDRLFDAKEFAMSSELVKDIKDTGLLSREEAELVGEKYYRLNFANPKAEWRQPLKDERHAPPTLLAEILFSLTEEKSLELPERFKSALEDVDKKPTLRGVIKRAFPGMTTKELNVATGTLLAQEDVVKKLGFDHPKESKDEEEEDEEKEESRLATFVYNLFGVNSVKQLPGWEYFTYSYKRRERFPNESIVADTAAHVIATQIRLVSPEAAAAIRRLGKVPQSWVSKILENNVVRSLMAFAWIPESTAILCSDVMGTLETPSNPEKQMHCVHACMKLNDTGLLDHVQLHETAVLIAPFQLKFFQDIKIDDESIGAPVVPETSPLAIPIHTVHYSYPVKVVVNRSFKFTKSRSY